MIDFSVSNRYTGKTTRLVNLYKKYGGHYFVYKGVSKSYMRKMHGINSFKYDLDALRGLRNTNLYFDDFFQQKVISLDDIIMLDRTNKFNIYIRSSLMNNTIPEHFIRYMADNYPESLI